jgi:hypothetical protein
MVLEVIYVVRHGVSETVNYYPCFHCAHRFEFPSGDGKQGRHALWRWKPSSKAGEQQPRMLPHQPGEL